jgi:hypothetical protein
MYFKAMGVPLLRASDYPRLDVYSAVMSQLEENELFDAGQLDKVIEECELFQAFLAGLFDQLGSAPELAHSLFDRRGAAEALRLYLGD